MKWVILGVLVVVGFCWWAIKVKQEEDAHIAARCEHTLSLARTAFDSAQAEMSCETLKRSVDAQRAASAAAGMAGAAAARSGARR